MNGDMIRRLATSRVVRRYRRTIGGVGLLVLVAVVSLVVSPLLRHAEAGTPAATPSGSTHYGSAPSYTLTDQLGRTVNSRQFAGKVQVVSYLFPYCTTYCPIIARNLVVLRQQLQQAGLGDKVELVAFNVDPAGAGPAQMRQFWSEFGGNPDDPNFEFLTGTPAQVQTVVADGFHVFYQKVPGAEESGPASANPLAQQAHVNYDIQHNDYIEIVDGSGHIRQLFDNGSQTPPAQLMTAVRAALG